MNNILFNKNDYLYGFKLDIDLSAISKSCITINNLVNNKYAPITKMVKEIAKKQIELNKENNPVFFNNMKKFYYWYLHTYYGSYNIFTFPFEGIIELYREIKKCFKLVDFRNENFYMEGWANVLEKNKINKIDWHSHFHESLKTWHGYFCINVNKTKTFYRIPGVDGEVAVEGESNLLVLARGDGDEHCTEIWKKENEPRITIGLNIVPEKSIDPEVWFNHWVPL